MITWHQFHGAMTHFPIALLLFAAFCEINAAAFAKHKFALGLRSASFYALVLAALGACGAVASGLAMNTGAWWSHGAVGWHQRFVWPAFFLLILVTVWRVVVKDSMSRFGKSIYLTLLLSAALLVAAAGYFGGELLLAR